MSRMPFAHVLLSILLMPVVPAGAMQEEVPEPVAEEVPADEAGAGKEAGVRKEVDEAIDALRAYSFERRDEAAARARQAIGALDGQIRELQAGIDGRWAGMSDDARARSRAAMQEIARTRNSAAEWYGGMRHGTAAAWGEVREGFVRSYDELAEALRRARDEFADDDGPAEDGPMEDGPPPEEAVPRDGR